GSWNEIVVPDDDWRSPSRDTDQVVPTGRPDSVKVTGHVGSPNEIVTVTFPSRTRTDPRSGEGTRPPTPDTEKLYVPLGSMKGIAVLFPVRGVPFSSTDQFDEVGSPTSSNVTAKTITNERLITIGVPMTVKFPPGGRRATHGMDVVAV